jgi:hypothetical protein
MLLTNETNLRACAVSCDGRAGPVGEVPVEGEVLMSQTVEVRGVTDDEVAFCRENGLVKLEGLISRELATTMLDRVKCLLMEADAPEGEQLVRKGNGVTDTQLWRDWHYLARDDKVEPLRSLALSPQLGKAAHQLIERNVPVQCTTI